MKVGCVEFVTFTEISEADDAWFALITNTFDYDGSEHSVTELHYGSGEYCLYKEDIFAKMKQMNIDDKFDEFEYCCYTARELYTEICEKEGIILLDYEQMEALENITSKNKTD